MSRSVTLHKNVIEIYYKFEKVTELKQKKSLTLDIRALLVLTSWPEKKIPHYLHICVFFSFSFFKIKLNTTTLSGVTQALRVTGRLIFLLFLLPLQKAMPPFKSVYLNDYRKE